MDQCYSSMLQLSLFRKQRKICPPGVRVGRPKRHEQKRNPQPNFGSSLFIYLDWASSQLRHVGSSSLTRAQTCAPYFRSTESYPRGPQGSPRLLFLYVFFLLALGPPCANWASQGGSLLCLKSSLWSSDLPVFHFRGPFPSLSVSHHPSELLFPTLTT